MWRNGLPGLGFGRFDYADTGVMDRTHMRWFTLATARELFAECGLREERFSGAAGRPTPPFWSGADRLCGRPSSCSTCVPSRLSPHWSARNRWARRRRSASDRVPDPSGHAKSGRERASQ